VLAGGFAARRVGRSAGRCAAGGNRPGAGISSRVHGEGERLDIEGIDRPGQEDQVECPMPRPGRPAWTGPCPAREARHEETAGGIARAGATGRAGSARPAQRKDPGGPGPWPTPSRPGQRPPWRPGPTTAAGALAGRRRPGHQGGQARDQEQECRESQSQVARRCRDPRRTGCRQRVQQAGIIEAFLFPARIADRGVWASTRVQRCGSSSAVPASGRLLLAFRPFLLPVRRASRPPVLPRSARNQETARLLRDRTAASRKSTG